MLTRRTFLGLMGLVPTGLALGSYSNFSPQDYKKPNLNFADLSTLPESDEDVWSPVPGEIFARLGKVIYFFNSHNLRAYVCNELDCEIIKVRIFSIVQGRCGGTRVYYDFNKIVSLKDIKEQNAITTKQQFLVKTKYGNAIMLMPENNYVTGKFWVFVVMYGGKVRFTAKADGNNLLVKEI